MGLIDICTNYLIFQKHLALLFSPIFLGNLKLCFSSFPELKKLLLWTRQEQTASPELSKIIEQQNSGKLFSTVSIQKIVAFIIVILKRFLVNHNKLQDGRVKYEKGGRKHESKGHYGRTIHKQAKEKIVFLKV